MSDQEFEQTLERLMKQDFSAGTDEFREALLERCLAELDDGEGKELDDSVLDMLAAAGELAAQSFDPLSVHENPNLSV